MNFDNVHIKNDSDLLTFSPNNISHNLVVEIESNLNNTYMERLSAAPNLFIWITFISIIGWIILEIIREFGTVKIDNKLMLSFTPKKCRSCQFYTQNPYLKCAIHPSIVLTKQANDCSDYYSKHKQIDK